MPRPGVPDDYVVMVVVHDAAGDAHLVVASPALEELARATLPEGGVPRVPFVLDSELCLMRLECRVKSRTKAGCVVSSRQLPPRSARFPGFYRRTSRFFQRVRTLAHL